jgi:hypothetical protein
LRRIDHELGASRPELEHGYPVQEPLPVSETFATDRDRTDNLRKPRAKVIYLSSALERCVPDATNSRSNAAFSVSHRKISVAVARNSHAADRLRGWLMIKMKSQKEYFKCRNER